MTSFPRSINTLLAALLAVSATATAAPPLVVDGDGDGISDERDECPYSGAGEKVNAEGCAVYSDADSDGVGDLADLCPYSTIGAKVDAQGCALDEDFDGVANGKDQCPNSAYGERVDSRGCEIIAPGAKSKAVAKQEEPVPATKLAPRSGPATVTLSANPGYVSEEDQYLLPPAKVENKPAAPPVVTPSPPPPPLSLSPAPPPASAPIAAAAPAPAAVSVAPAPATLAPAKTPEPVAAAESRAAVPVAATPVASEPVTKPAPVVAIPVPPAAPPMAEPAPASAPAVAAASPAPVVHEKPVVEQVTVNPRQLPRQDVDRLATMSPAAEDRTPSLPKAEAVNLPVPSLPASEFPPGSVPNRTAPKVEVPVGRVSAAASVAARRPAAAPGSVPEPPVPSVTRPLPVAPTVPVSGPTARIIPPGARGAGPVVELSPSGDSSSRADTALPISRGPAPETLAEIGFAVGSSELSKESAQRVRELSSAISAKLSENPGLLLRLVGRRQSGEPAQVEAGRGLALRQAFIAEGVDEARIRIVVGGDSPRVDASGYRAAVQLIDIQ